MANTTDAAGVKENIYAVLIGPGGKKVVYRSHNIVTDAGDVYYAQRGASEVPTNAFTIMELGTAGSAPLKTSNRSDISAFVAISQKTFDVGYPRTNDPDIDNPGTPGIDVVTYRVSYTTAQANAALIDRIFLTNITPGAAEPLLSYGVFGVPFTKDATQTLKMFINHEMLGA